MTSSKNRCAIAAPMWVLAYRQNEAQKKVIERGSEKEREREKGRRRGGMMKKNKKGGERISQQKREERERERDKKKTERVKEGGFNILNTSNINGISALHRQMTAGAKRLS